MYKSGYSKLNSFQKEIIDDCIQKGKGGLSLPMGSGKTLISLVLSLYYNEKTKKKTLVVVPKTLIEGWIVEIKKFFDDELKYIILHHSYNKLDKDISSYDIIITTPEVMLKFYGKYNIEEEFIYKNEASFIKYNSYSRPMSPFSTSKDSLFYHSVWGLLIIDEIQKFTNIETLSCKSISSVCAINRFGLSGTIIDEPKINRILGYYMILNYPGIPRNKYELNNYITSYSYEGLNKSMIIRTQNVNFVPPKINQKIISHDVSKDEEIIYVMLKHIMGYIKELLFDLKGDIDFTREYNSYLLVLMIYLRQSVICPIIPIANAMLDASEYKNRSKLANMIVSNIGKLGLTDYLENLDSPRSSRIQEIMKIIKNHKNSKIVIFTSFRSCLDMMDEFIKREHTTFSINSLMTPQTRQKTLNNFKNSDNGVLLLTYQIGAEGLNLQFADTVLLADYWWNSGKTEQAIARILRFGQMSEIVNIYFFTSNLGIEKCIFEKHIDKLNIVQEILEGPLKNEIRSMDMEEMIKIIQKENNNDILDQINEKIKNKNNKNK